MMGGVIGPKILKHVKCQSCGAKYNGKTGSYNTTAIIIYLVIFGVVDFLNDFRVWRLGIFRFVTSLKFFQKILTTRLLIA